MCGKGFLYIPEAEVLAVTSDWAPSGPQRLGSGGGRLKCKTAWRTTQPTASNRSELTTYRAPRTA